MPASNVVYIIMVNDIFVRIHFQVSLKTSKGHTASAEEQVGQFQKMFHEQEVRKVLFESVYRIQS